ALPISMITSCFLGGKIFLIGISGRIPCKTCLQKAGLDMISPKTLSSEKPNHCLLLCVFFIAHLFLKNSRIKFTLYCLLRKKSAKFFIKLFFQHNNF